MRTSRSSAAVAPPSGNPQISVAPPSGNPQISVAPPSGNPQSGVAPPSGSPQSSDAPPSGSPQSSVAPPSGNPQSSVAPPSDSPQSSVAPPFDGPQKLLPLTYRDSLRTIPGKRGKRIRTQYIGSYMLPPAHKRNIIHGIPDTAIQAIKNFKKQVELKKLEDNFKKQKELEEKYGCSEILGTVMKTVALTIKLELPDFVNLFSVSHSVYNAFLSALPLWQTLNFREVNSAGDRLLSALSLTRYHNVEHIDLASAKGIEDKHLKLLKTKKNVVGSLENLESLNLDCCRNISDSGVQDVLSTCPRLKKFSIGNNLRVTDFFINSLVKNCSCLTHLNLSGCKNITDESFLTISNTPFVSGIGLESLDISRCERVTDAGVIAIAEGCPSLKFLSLSGIPGLTNKCLEFLHKMHKFHSNTPIDVVWNQ